jgi:hypothetical protein
MSSERSPSTPDTFCRFVSSVLICSSRDAERLGERRDALERLPELVRGVASEVRQGGQRPGELVGVDLLEVSARPAKASTTSYGEVVRSTGIVDSSAS